MTIIITPPPPIAVDVSAGPDVTVAVDVSAGPLVQVDVAAMGVPGLQGAPGDGVVNDVFVATLLSDPGSASSGAVVEIVHDETDPLIDLDVLFDNAIA